MSFDPETVTDHSTYTQGMLPATGFGAVLIGGQVVLRDDRVLLDTTAGRPIRFAPLP